MTTSYSRTWTPSWPLVPRVQRSRTAPRVPGIPSGIVDSGQKSRVAATRQGAALLGRDDANLGLLLAPANCRQIQHSTTGDNTLHALWQAPPRRMPRAITLAAVAVLLAGIAFAATVASMTSRASSAPPVGVVATTAPPVCVRDPAWMPPPKPDDYRPQPAGSYDPKEC
jgi:hypothetical protein